MTTPPGARRIDISIVVAMARNRVIGRNGQLPWCVPSDLATFRRLTLGKPVIMGRKTFQSLAKPLPGRMNLVVTRDPTLRTGIGAIEVAPDTTVAAFASFDAAIVSALTRAATNGIDEVMIIGGAEVYRAAFPRASRIYLTEIDAAPDGDTHFPELDDAIWREVSRVLIPPHPRDEYAATLVTYDRR
ncbi:MAG TPA: dihydrofolate reductase [Hyphomicrobiaceae bacterium]|nr:dihydrofolate reductase [Hyphomicrobiaceae bacterium]